MVPSSQGCCEEQWGLILQLELCLAQIKNSVHFSYFCMRGPEFGSQLIELRDLDRPLTFLGLGFSSVKQRWDDIHRLDMPMKFLLNGPHAHWRDLNQPHEWLSVELTSIFRILQQQESTCPDFWKDLHWLLSRFRKQWPRRPRGSFSSKRKSYLLMKWSVKQKTLWKKSASLLTR